MSVQVYIDRDLVSRLVESVEERIEDWEAGGRVEVIHDSFINSPDTIRLSRPVPAWVAKARDAMEDGREFLRRTLPSPLVGAAGRPSATKGR